MAIIKNMTTGELDQSGAFLVRTEIMGYRFTNREDLDTAVDEWIDNRSAPNSTYGDINNWDVSS